MYLLDTHVLPWARFDPDRLSASYREIITSPHVQKFISGISIWEISLKFALGKLELGGHSPEEFLATARQLGLGVVSPEAEHYASFHRLQPVVGHNDPFDRMLIWQAIQTQMTLLSHDGKLAEYKPVGLNLA